MICKTERLILREMTIDDLPALCRTLQDPIAMAAYEHAFTDEEAQHWHTRQLERYERDGFGLWAAELSDTGEVVGQCGLMLQSVGAREVLEIGYLFERAFWHCGYATEAARGCKKYAFETLGAEEVFSIIRDSNIASMNVAIRNGMLVRERFIKHYYGIDMPHLLFSVKREEYDNRQEWSKS